MAGVVDMSLLSHTDMESSLASRCSMQLLLILIFGVSHDPPANRVELPSC